MDVLGPQRDLFEIPREVAYLNCAYKAPQLRAVTEAGIEAVRRGARPWAYTVEDFFVPGERARERFAALIGGDADGVALVPSVSYGIGVAAANVAVGRGRNVVLLAEQFPSNVYPWREKVRRDGGEVRTVPRPATGSWTQGVLDAIDDATAVVAVPHHHWTDGTVVDLLAVGRAARAVGAALVVDGTQSIGAVPFSVAEVRPDFVVAATYKWLLGPYSLGFLWAAPHRRAGVPLEFNWITREDAQDFAALVDYRDGYQPGARRYDVGERSHFVLLPMALAAIDQLLAWRPERIANSLAFLTGLVEEETRGRGLDPVPAADRGPHLLGVRLPGGVPADLPARLAERRVFVSVRGDSVRVSPHLYNTVTDVERLVDALI